MTLEWHAASRIQMKVQRAHPRCEIPHVMQSMSKAAGDFQDPHDTLIVMLMVCSQGLCKTAAMHHA